MAPRAASLREIPLDARQEPKKTSARRKRLAPVFGHDDDPPIPLEWRHVDPSEAELAKARLDVLIQELQDIGLKEQPSPARVDLLSLVRRRPREAVMGASLLLLGFCSIALVTGKVLARAIIAPDVGLVLSLSFCVFFAMAWVAGPNEP